MTRRSMRFVNMARDHNAGEQSEARCADERWCKLSASAPRSAPFFSWNNLPLNWSRCRGKGNLDNAAEQKSRRMMMTTVRQVLDSKGSDVLYVSPDASVFDAIAKMAEKDVGSLAVMDGDELVGVFTERNYARNVFLKGRASPKTPVREVMEEDVFIARPEQSVEQCLALMTDRRVRHLPVLEGKNLIGIISIGDLVKSIIGEKEFIIDQLEHYIHGHR
jgi:CBS domain-containing protein